MILEELVELQNVGVVHALEDTNLALELVFLVLLEILFVYYFDRSEGLCFFVQTFPYLSIRAYKQTAISHGVS